MCVKDEAESLRVTDYLLLIETQGERELGISPMKKTMWRCGVTEPEDIVSRRRDCIS